MTDKANRFVSPDNHLLHLITETNSSLFDEYDLKKSGLCLLDWAAVAVAGSREPCAKILLDHAQQEGGEAQSTLIGTGKCGTARQAALFNGTAAHAHDFDDTYPAIPAHTTVPVASAVWAAAERDGRTGLEIITSVITGIEVICRLGLALCPDHYRRGWHASATLGAIGASAACAKLHGLKGKTIMDALELAACRAAGTKAAFGSMAKPLQLGQAAALGLESADLAQRGFTSSKRVLNAADGFYALHSNDFSDAPLKKPLGGEFHIHGNHFKYHASCFLTHGAIEAAKTFFADNGGHPPTSIKQIHVCGHPELLKVCDNPGPQTGLAAKFSVQFCVALALTGKDTSALSTFGKHLTRDSELRNLMNKTTLEASANLNHEEAEVTFSLKDESTTKIFGEPVSSTEPDEERPAIEAKARSLCEPVVGKEGTSKLIQLFSALQTLDHIPDYSGL